MHSTPRTPHRSARSAATPSFLAFSARLVLTALLLVAAACSIVPERRWPPRLVGEIEVVHDHGGAIEVPSSDSELTVLELVSDPPPLAERFEGDRRIWVLPEGGASISCRYRLFGDADAAPDPFAAAPRVAARFPGARVIRHRTLPRPAPAAR